MITLIKLKEKPWNRGERGDFTKHAKKTNVTNRDEWDWSLSNCELGRMYGMSPQAVRKTRIRLGKETFRKEKAPPKELIPTRACALTLHDLRDGPKAHTPWRERFWKFVNKRSENECWEWNGFLSSGYGLFGVGILGENRAQYVAHRVSYVMHHGPIEAGYVIRHKCDNRKCVNPNHLEIGFQRDNVMDAVNRKGMNQGEKNGQSKLTRELVSEIRETYKNGGRIFQIANAVGLPQGTIHGIVKNKSWRHV